MRSASNRTSWQRAAAVAAAAFVFAAAVGANEESHAQNFPYQHAKKAPYIKGGGAAGPNRMGLRGPMSGPGARFAPNPAHGLRGPGFANRDLRFNSRGNRTFGNQPGNRFGNRPFGNQGRFNQARGFTNRDPRLRAVNGATSQSRQAQRFSLRREMLSVRARMPVFPLPGERNFTGVPPAAESRFVSTEMVSQWGPDTTQQRIEDVARRHNLTIVGLQRSALTGGTLVRFRIGGGRSARDVVRAMEAEQIISQPNYIYEAAQEPAAAQSTDSSGSEQYVVNKLRLDEVHKIATGKGVTVAVIDSEVDRKHPELGAAIAEEFDAVGQPDKPHTHGTGMAGAIVAHDRLTGIAPGARTLAVHAFSTNGPQQSAQATTQHIIAGLDWALAKGARVINMSFAGPYDPMLALALKRASEKGAILIAAVGNAGPKSPPLYPAADTHVIGVTATDENDKLYPDSNIGAQVAVAAPGVNVMVPAPAGAYQLTTGTSVAAAHVSGVAALLLERHPEADAQTILEVLTASATRVGTNKRDDQMGWGLVDPIAAMAELDARVADMKVAAPKAPARAPTTVSSSESTAAPAPASASSRATLPRPGLFPLRQ